MPTSSNGLAEHIKLLSQLFSLPKDLKLLISLLLEGNYLAVDVTTLSLCADFHFPFC